MGEEQGSGEFWRCLLCSSNRTALAKRSQHSEEVPSSIRWFLSLFVAPKMRCFRSGFIAWNMRVSALAQSTPSRATVQLSSYSLSAPSCLIILRICIRQCACLFQLRYNLKVDFISSLAALLAFRIDAALPLHKAPSVLSRVSGKLHSLSLWPISFMFLQFHNIIT